MTSSFSNLSLAEPLARAVAEMGYETMTPIQEQAIPVVLSGQDVMGAAQTGTGKTAAFSLPLLQRMLKHENSSTSPARHPVRALVLLPTRELADQVAQQVKLYAKYTNLRCAVVFGGMDMKPQTLELKKGVEVLVATPGRLLDHIEAKNAVLNQVEYVVLDEADRMLDIGFLPDLQRILSHLPKQRTTLLFSATFSPEIKRLSASYLQNPVTIEVARPNETASTVEQRFFSVSDDDKRRALRQIIQQRGITQAFVFVNSKLGCARLARSLEREGLRTTALHGDKSQDERLKALDAFKKGEVDLLVCTDVAARGLDIKDVPAVFNFDIPFNAEDYVHRIGRTGEAEAGDTREVLDTLEAPRERAEPRAPRGGGRPHRAPSASRDPFFEQPYEAPEREAAPTWETTAKGAPARGISANIKPKRKVAALFKSSEPS
jgi:ATP-dependent RNA helicase RhlE